MDNLEHQPTANKGFNLLWLVIGSSIIFTMLNVLFYQRKDITNYFEIAALTLLLLTTLFLIYITQKNSRHKYSFYYYTAIGFTFIYFGLFVQNLYEWFVYDENVIKIATRLLFVLGYSLLAIGVTKWIKYNEQKHDELSIQANTDELTGMLNRRSFVSFLNYEFNKARKNCRPFALIIIDIDFFKNVNDSHGHLFGDEVLKHLAKTMNKSFRSGDKICRWGGEEFAILLPDTSLENAKFVAEKIRKTVAEQKFGYNNTLISYTISLGISEFLATDVDGEAVVSRADAALYQAKNNNRNCVRSIRA